MSRVLTRLSGPAPPFPVHSCNWKQGWPAASSPPSQPTPTHCLLHRTDDVTGRFALGVMKALMLRLWMWIRAASTFAHWVRFWFGGASTDPPAVHITRVLEQLYVRRPALTLVSASKRDPMSCIKVSTPTVGHEARALQGPIWGHGKIINYPPWTAYLFCKNKTQSSPIRTGGSKGPVCAPPDPRLGAAQGAGPSLSTGTGLSTGLGPGTARLQL